MSEIPRDSDLAWQAAMNSAPIDRMHQSRRVPLPGGSTEPVYGFRVDDRPPIPSAKLAEVANLVDDVFAELLQPPTDQ